MGLTVIGRGQQHAAYLIHALGQAGAQGLRPDNVPMGLVQIEREAEAGRGNWISSLGENGLELSECSNVQPPPAPHSIQVVFKTPLRIKRDNDLLTPANFDFADLAVGLVRRVALLSEYHTEQPWIPDFRVLKNLASGLSWTAKDLGWKEITRASQRQKTKMQMGGIVGRVQLEGDAWRPWWPLIWLGELVGAGKATSMGLGRYEVRPLT